VKLSARSPKDVAHLREDLIFNDLITEEVIKTISPSNTDSAIQDALAFCRACGRANRVTNGKQALWLLLNSQRIYDDLLIYVSKIIDIQQVSEDSNLPLKLVVRKWVDIDPTSECRAFVFGGELRAMTQYHPSYFVPALGKPEIEVKILDLFSTIKNLIQQKNYTIDFALSGDLQSIWIVELNNPPPVAGTVLFHWNSDKEIITNGPYQFRILQHPSQDPTEAIPPNIVKLMKAIRTQHTSKNESNICILQ